MHCEIVKISISFFTQHPYDYILSVTSKSVCFVSGNWYITSLKSLMKKIKTDIYNEPIQASGYFIYSKI
jgi:hypothetical protein